MKKKDESNTINNNNNKVTLVTTGKQAIMRVLGVEKWCSVVGKTLAYHLKGLKQDIFCPFKLL